MALIVVKALEKLQLYRRILQFYKASMLPSVQCRIVFTVVEVFIRAIESFSTQIRWYILQGCPQDFLKG